MVASGHSFCWYYVSVMPPNITANILVCQTCDLKRTIDSCFWTTNSPPRSACFFQVPQLTWWVLIFLFLIRPSFEIIKDSTQYTGTHINNPLCSVLAFREVCVFSKALHISVSYLIVFLFETKPCKYHWLVLSQELASVIDKWKPKSSDFQFLTVPTITEFTHQETLICFDLYILIGFPLNLGARKKWMVNFYFSIAIQ